MSVARRDRDLAAVHENFLAAPSSPLPDSVRPIVAESWRRSLALGVDPCAGSAPLDLSEDELARYRERHPLAPMMPLIRRLLTDDADEAGHIVAIGDANGRLLWVEGHHRLRHQAEGMQFVEGALWSERGAGTNAPGTALALDLPVQIRAAEHFGTQAQAWSCVAAPVLTGGPDVAGPRTLALVRACAAAVEAGLQLQVPVAPPAATGAGYLRLLGPEVGVFSTDDGRRVHLSRRHTELIWLLASAPNGLSAQALDVALHLGGEHLTTIRAEINRLRRVLGPGLLESRPYRLTVPISTDVDRIRADLAQGRLMSALKQFDGAPLPGSDAPGVRSLTEEFVAELRQAVLDSGSAPALERWTSLPDGHDDAGAWSALVAALPVGSPRWAMATARRRRLD
jgi:hypothetical protein